jgi:ketosteroid isomerase-like protein
MNTTTQRETEQALPRHADEAERQIRAILADWSEGHRLKDASRIVSHLTNDNVQFILAPPLQYSGKQGWDKQAFEAWFAGFEGPIGWEVRDLSIAAGTDIAFCHFMCCLSATAVGQGDFSLWFRNTFGFQQRAGRWRVTHVHSSVPFHMDGSFRAAIDLTP